MKQYYEIPDLVWTDNGIGEYRCMTLIGIFSIDKHDDGSFFWQLSTHRSLWGEPSSLEQAQAVCNKINRELLEKMLTKVQGIKCYADESEAMAGQAVSPSAFDDDLHATNYR